jgi:hypothetical protein
VDLSVAYYNSKPQVKAMLVRMGDLVAAIAALEGPGPVPPLSQLALASRNGGPRAVRDRLEADELERLLLAARAGIPRKHLVAEFGVSRKTIYRLVKTSGG